MAFATWPRNGFTLSKRSNTNESYVRKFNAAASTNQPIATGDAVAFVGGQCVPCTAGQDPAQAFFGVVMGCYTTAGRPFSEQTVKIIASGGVGQVDVCYDPSAEYVVRCEVSVGPSNLNTNVVLAGLSANSVLGRTYATVTIPASASTNDLFRLIRLADQNDIYGVNGYNIAGGAGQPVVVRVNRGTYKTGTAGGGN